MFINFLSLSKISSIDVIPVSSIAFTASVSFSSFISKYSLCPNLPYNETKRALDIAISDSNFEVDLIL